MVKLISNTKLSFISTFYKPLVIYLMLMLLSACETNSLLREELLLDYKLSSELKAKESRITINNRAVSIGIVEATGVETEFVLGEIVVLYHLDQKSELDRIINRWNGKLVEDTPPKNDILGLAVIQIDLETAPKKINLSSCIGKTKFTDTFKQLNEAIPINFSSNLAYATVAISFRETCENNNIVSIKPLNNPSDHISYADLISGPANNSNSLLNNASHEYNVTKAWNILAAAEKLHNQTKVAIADGGFLFADSGAPSNAYPDGALIFNEWNGPSAFQDNPNRKWHGTNVAAVALGPLNSAVPGTAAPVGEMVAIQVNDLFSIINGLSRVLGAPSNDRVRVLNISGGFNYSEFLIPITIAARTLFSELNKKGVIVIASAGNNGSNVDHEEQPVFFMPRAEYTLTAPCEYPEVMCVGGMSRTAFRRHSNSNFGTKNDSFSVEIYAPYQVLGWRLGLQGFTPGNTLINGTSYSAPFDAGVAALVSAANPDLSSAQIRSCLFDSAHRGVQGVASNNDRMVDAKAAVLCAIPDNEFPIINIIDYNDNRNGTITLNAFAFDSQGNKLPITWTSSRDPSPRLGNALGLAGGSHLITGEVTSGTNSNSDTILVNLENSPPRVEVLWPMPHQRYFLGESVPIVTRVFDQGIIPISGVTMRMVDKRTQDIFGVVKTGRIIPGRTNNRMHFHTSVYPLSAGSKPIEVKVSDGSDSNAALSRVKMIEPVTANSRPKVTVVAENIKGQNLPLCSNPTSCSSYYIQDIFRYRSSAFDPEDGVLNNISVIATNTKSQHTQMICDGTRENCHELIITSTTVERIYDKILPAGTYVITSYSIDSEGLQGETSSLIEIPVRIL